MKPWNVSRIQPGHSEEPRSKALARKLRDWLNGFLEEAGGEYQSSAVALPASPIPSREEQAGAPARSALNQAGPPEDWLRRVREGAPGLLLPAEEGGTPRLRVPRAAIGKSQPEREIASTPAVPVRSPQASFESREPRADRAQTSPATPASGKKAWLKQLKRQFISAVFPREAEREKSRHQEHSAAASEFQAGRDHPGALGRARHEFAGDVQPLQEQPTVPPAMPKRRDAATVATRWTERVKQSIQAVLQTAPANPSTSVAPAESKKVQRPYQPAATVPPATLAPANFAPPDHAPATLSREAATTAVDVGAEADRGSSQPAVTFRTFERSSKPGGHDLSPSKQQWPVRDVPASTINSRTWMPLPARARELANRNRESAEPGTGSEPGASRTGEWSAIQPVDQWAIASGHTPKSERVDLWPELPEDEALATSEWTQLLRKAERLRALDLEQRGGR
jgi:hypothetical protein